MVSDTESIVQSPVCVFWSSDTLWKPTGCLPVLLMFAPCIKALCVFSPFGGGHALLALELFAEMREVGESHLFGNLRKISPVGERHFDFGFFYPEVVDPCVEVQSVGIIDEVGYICPVDAYSLAEMHDCDSWAKVVLLFFPFCQLLFYLFVCCSVMYHRPFIKNSSKLQTLNLL